MSHAYERDANLVGAMALALADRVQAAVEQAGGHGASGPAALAALHGTAAGASIDALARIVRLPPLGRGGRLDRRSGADRRAHALGRCAARRPARGGWAGGAPGGCRPSVDSAVAHA